MTLFIKRIITPSRWLVPLVMLAGCSSQPYHSSVKQHPDIPKQWLHSVDEGNANLADGGFSLPKQLTTLIDSALVNNQQLQRQRLNWQIAQQQALANNANFWPSLDLSSSVSQRENDSGSTTSGDLRLSMQYEVDIWGKLADSERQASAELSSAQLSYQQSKQTLVYQVMVAWLNVIEADKLLTLNKLRLNNAQQNLAIIESGYQQGLNKALDVYLSRNELANEQTRVANQQYQLANKQRELGLLLGRFTPVDSVNTEAELTIPHTYLAAPAQVLTKRLDLQKGWLAILKQDANLAFQHKRRFPSLKLTGSSGSSTTQLSELLSLPNLTWSLAAGITASIFDGGKIAASKQIAQNQLTQAELSYVEKLQQAFAEIEKYVANNTKLTANLATTKQSAENAQMAQTLSFEQYQKGLVNYTTVLNAQTRSANAKSSLVQLEHQLLINKLALYVALGGDFSAIINNKDVS